ncbi:HU family DNA-binding protein [Roseicella frigidaeris]|uniref:HU family DNA-binding protein n=1 Tax=Roseicella frigidaeris TaxID=2230885 RepID=A0A327MCZ7_9PROT|nr:HU family DNA-binding protein [Roseicella frigidaeris]RAI60425.1 HU family DNA-binding protein [Roseicella frigidaeris]
MSATTTAKSTAKATTTTTLKQMAAGLAESNDLPKKTVETVLNGLVAEVMKHLQAGEKVRLTGLGILQVKKRAARTGRNPATGAEIQIAESKKLAFTAAKEAKEAI